MFVIKNVKTNEIMEKCKSLKTAEKALREYRIIDKHSGENIEYTIEEVI